MTTTDKTKKAEYQSKWYQKNKDQHKHNVKKNKEEVRHWYRELKKTLKCNRCSENHPSCLQFHHTDPNVKEKSISMAPHDGWNKERILNEISKCEVICANCHFKEHYVDPL